MNKTYDRENVFLVPRSSDVNSRDEVDLSVELGSLKLEIPIVGSPMKGIMNPKLVKKLSGWGGIGILHRFCSDEKFRINIDKVQGYKFGQAVGLGDIDRAEYAVEYGAAIICVDVANGYLSSVLDFCDEVANYITQSGHNTLLMCGNVVNMEGVNNLIVSGVDIVRIGIGTGNLCRTKQKTKVGYGQVTALMDCAMSDVFLISDGGIKEPGDAVLDLACGADLVMIGSLFAQTFESAHNGEIYGMASRRLQEDYHHSVKSVEGIEQQVYKTVDFDTFMEEFLYGMKSSFTYQNARNIRELQENAEFVEIL